MTQFNDKVERQRLLLAAEEMRDNVTNIHCHRLDSMWYETEKTKSQTKDGVMDVTYMDGRIERTLNQSSTMQPAREKVKVMLLVPFIDWCSMSDEPFSCETVLETRISFEQRMMYRT